ncbi:leucine--tRNA ligase [Candidatus Woesearchaeota archaeon]|nr:leucine--tRNA ligase [Candidatus Woesearchaeota archaeon]
MADLKVIQDKWQQLWAESNLFEVDPDDKKEKFFMTIPYPYISGSLHIGHARVVTEADVFSRFQRMTGKNVLFPIAFHISGTPVLGISLAIKSGDNSKIALYRGYVKRYISDDKKIDSIVKSFEDPQNIVDFFIPRMISEFKTLGLAVDWRRSYTSGDDEHQALVEWQFREYMEKGYLVQGKYPILFSRTLSNAVGEDDIQDGDTDSVDIQEFTAIKFAFEDGFIIAATLRPETMYGQTNMWANPDVKYVKAKVDDEIWYMSSECADKLSFQDKKVEILGTVKGLDLMGKKCFAPFVKRELIILPSSHCDPSVGTGLVTSVPSDAPFDYMALKELQDSADICAKYGLNHEDIKAIDLIPIIKSKGFNEFPAVEICTKMGIKSLTQHELLSEATQEIYKLGFHTGVMMDACGQYSGLPVIKAKDDMRDDLLSKGKAVIFYETSRPAKSRDGGDVIVAIMDNQWFLDFNAKGWKDDAYKCLKNMQIWPDKYRKQFEDVFDWLDKRPCARKRGLGTRLPFDKDWIIESLSDSTIYMSLYPIIHILRAHKIPKDFLTDNVFRFVMRSEGDAKSVSEESGISQDVLKKLCNEWNYWYPFDQRHTFNAHLSNHLSFMIFAHTAVFSEKHWPKRVSFHGMVMSEGHKMSKSKGNVVTIVDLNERFGSDAFRAFMCNSTSVDNVFNWNSDKVAVMRKHIDHVFEVVSELRKDCNEDDSYLKFNSFVSRTERSIKKATANLKDMDLRDYSNTVLYDMLKNYKKVKSLAEPDELRSLNAYVGSRWVRMLCPLVPHIAEELWSMDPASDGFVSTSQWPDFDENLIDDAAEYQDEIIDRLKKDIHTVLNLAKIDKPNNITVLVASEWKYEFVGMLKGEMESTSNPGEIIRAIMASDLKKHGQEIMKLIPKLVSDRSKIPEIVFSQAEEIVQMESVRYFLESEFGCEIAFVRSEESDEQKARNAMPGKPAIVVN